MSEIYFTSDTHFGHANIIKYCNRPFENTEQMNKVMLERWNDRIRPQDTVYHLGDFSFRNATGSNNLYERLNGKIHFIRGNHDKVTLNAIRDGHFKVEWVKDYYEFKWNKTTFVLMHYPIASWNKMYHRSINVHGHCHANYYNPGYRQIDVGVDVWDFYPVHITEVVDAAEYNYNFRDSMLASDEEGVVDRSYRNVAITLPRNLDAGKKAEKV